MANWGNALMAVLVDDRFNGGLPANLVPEPGVNSGFKGMQLSVTSLACAMRQMAGPSSIHSLPTEQYNQDVVSLGMHAAVTAMDALECLRNETAMVLLASAQAVDLRGGPAKLGRGSRTYHEHVRQVARFQDKDRPMEHEVAARGGENRRRGDRIRVSSHSRNALRHVQPDYETESHRSLRIGPPFARGNQRDGAGPASSSAAGAGDPRSLRATQ